MDQNKRKTLDDIGYVIRRTCQVCVFSTFPTASSMWGNCIKHSYEHEKHGTRELSIHRSGLCFDYTSGASKFAELGGFAELIDER